jgi:hypothetical protein
VTFSVVWRQSVLDALADLYVILSLEEQDRMAAGVKTFNARVAREPFDVGEGREDDHDRIAFMPLLIIGFQVDPAARVVRVTGVTRFGR